MSIVNQNVLEHKILCAGEYIQLCAEVCDAVRYYANSPAQSNSSKVNIQEACEFAVQLLRRLRNCIHPIFDKARMTRTLKKAEYVLLQSNDYVFSGDYAIINNLYKDMWLVNHELKLVERQFCDFSGHDLQSITTKGQGYNDIVKILCQNFEELSIRPYSQ